MESFSRYLAYYEKSGQLTGMKISRSAPKIKHLLFADDCLLFCKANERQVQKLLQVIEQFSSFSGQLINFNKSAVYFSFNLEPEVFQSISGSLKVRYINISEEEYLGLPFFVGRRKRIPFSILCDKMDHKFSNWSGSNMSEAARSLMIKNVSNAIPIHRMTSFKLPDVTIKRMSSKQQQFWRNKKSCRGNYIITWRRTQKPKEEGGLGFRDMHIFNKALLAKSGWKLSSITDSMMVQSLQAKYFQDGNLFNLKKNYNTTWSWRSMSSELKFVQDNSSCKISTDEICKRSITVWCLWKDRCDKVFQNISPNTERTILKCHSFINDHSAQVRITHSSTIRVCRQNVHWSPPPMNFVCINVDGSYLNNVGGVGLIIRNFAGLEKVHFHLDALRVVEAVNNNASIDWQLLNMIKDIQIPFRSFSSWKCSYVPKEGNKVADILSRLARENALTDSWSDSSPVEIRGQLCEDQTHILIFIILNPVGSIQWATVLSFADAAATFELVTWRPEYMSNIFWYSRTDPKMRIGPKENGFCWSDRVTILYWSSKSSQSFKTAMMSASVRIECLIVPRNCMTSALFQGASVGPLIIVFVNNFGYLLI
ncbi:uncharacterized protein LOC113311168 [Papaver somniferum]|uniref:uncharacterized protein LOC113311168 n=1 Tax=Papaver somniferum TaxID=3469 RepID=UPI000E6FFAAA|nr:uncharacterized protein LOC113311168 [Papaver somniferum]